MAKSGLRALTALLVDDNLNMLTLLKVVLQGLGIGRTDESSNPADAFDLFRTGRHDLIFLDLKMPVLDGAEFIRLVRTAPDSPNPFIPIIVVSAYSERRHVLAARDAGATEFIRKPMNAIEVYNKIRSVIEKPRAFVRAKSYVGPDRRRQLLDAYPGSERRADKVKFEI